MGDYEISYPQPDIVRVAFPENWDAETESTDMFRDLFEAINDSEEDVTLLVVADQERPSYEGDALRLARNVLTHENIKQMVVVAEEASNAVNHMGATRGQFGLPPIPIYACATEDEAQQYL
jgi:hypothetical protein